MLASWYQLADSNSGYDQCWTDPIDRSAKPGLLAPHDQIEAFAEVSAVTPV